MMYIQCKLQKENRYQVSWIPEKFAVLNKILKLKENEIWEDGWKVIEIGGLKLEKVPHVPTLIRHHRKKTGDSNERCFP